MSIEQLHTELEAEGIPLPENERNPRHLIRALETGGVPANKQALLPWTLVIGLQVERDELKKHIGNRVKDMVKNGLENEVRVLAKSYGWQHEALSAVGYREWQTYFEDKQNLEKTIGLITKNTLAYAKRQRTWFKRNKSIQWVSHPSEALELTTNFLNNLKQN